MMPDFVRTMQTSSQASRVLAQIANDLSNSPDEEMNRQIHTQAANHLLPSVHPAPDMRHVINSRRDTRSNINASHDRRHESEMRRRKSMIEITAHQHAAARPGRNQRQPLRAALPQADRLGRGYTTRDDGRPLGTAVATTLARIVKRPGGHVESQPFPPGSGRSSGRLTSRSPTSTSTSLSKIRTAG